MFLISQNQPNQPTPKLGLLTSAANLQFSAAKVGFQSGTNSSHVVQQSTAFPSSLPSFRTYHMTQSKSKLQQQSWTLRLKALCHSTVNKVPCEEVFSRVGAIGFNSSASVTIGSQQGTPVENKNNNTKENTTCTDFFVVSNFFYLRKSTSEPHSILLSTSKLTGVISRLKEKVLPPSNICDLWQHSLSKTLTVLPWGDY